MGKEGERVSWVYEQTEPKLFTVGFYDPDGQWHPDSDHSTKEEAAKRVCQLNGGYDNYIVQAIGDHLMALEARLDKLDRKTQLGV